MASGSVVEEVVVVPLLSVIVASCWLVINYKEKTQQTTKKSNKKTRSEKRAIYTGLASSFSRIVGLSVNPSENKHLIAITLAAGVS